MPKAEKIQTPYAARPGALASPVPQEQGLSKDEEAALEEASKWSPDEQAALDAAKSFTPEQSKGLEIAPEFGTMAEQGAISKQALETAKIFGTEMAGGAATSLPGAMIGGAIGAWAGGGIGAPIGAYAGNVIGSYFTKDVVNPLRKIVGLPSEEDRARETDVFLSLFFGIPGLLKGMDEGFEAIAKGLDKSAIDPDLAKSVVVESNIRELNKDQAQIIAAMSPEDRMIMRSVRDAVVAAQKDLYTGEKVFTPEIAAQKAFEFESDWVALTKRDGLNAAQAAQVLMNKYGNTIQANKLVNDLATTVGEKLSQEDLLAITAQPGKIIELKKQRLMNQWSNAVETLRKVKNIPGIDSREYMKNVEAARQAALDAGDMEAAKHLDNIITNLGERKKVLDASVFAERTGGKPPTFTDVDTGKRLTAKSGEIPFPQTQEPLEVSAREPIFEVQTKSQLPTRGRSDILPQGRESIPQSRDEGPFLFETQKVERPAVSLGKREVTLPESEQLGLSLRQKNEMTAKQRAESLLPAEYPTNELVIPPAFARQTQGSIIQSIDVLIKKRARLDAIARNLPEGEKKQAYIAAVSALRDVEDPFIDALIGSGNSQFRSAGISYKSAKGGLRELNSAVDSIGNFANQDSLSVARALDSADPKIVKTWSGVMPVEVRQKIAREFVMNKLGMTEGLPIAPIKPEQANRVAKVIGDPSFLSKVNSLVGEGAGKQIQDTMKQLYKASRIASTLPEGSLAKSPGLKKVIFDAVYSLARVAPQINRFYAGRYLLEPNSRAYRDFIKFSMSSDFDATMNSIQGITEINAAKTEINKLFPVQDNIAQRALRVLDGKAASIPYVGSYISQKTLYPVGGAARGALIGRGKTEGGAGDFQMEKDQPSDFRMEGQ
jgi:hypothetical protein